ELNIVQDTITGLEANLAELEREFGGMRMSNRRLQQQYNLMRGECNRAIGERNRALGEHNVARNRLVYANNQTIKPSSISSQPSTKYDMAAIGIAAPIFHGREDKDLNLFIDNFLGYINTVSIDLLDDAGAPPGRMRAMGVLRSYMRDEAARWFDAELTGKNWELSSIRLVAAANGGASATHRAFRALAIPEVANGLHV
ncbi:12544_t:CDS:2, partial [Rhizophagus irregularis]